MTKNVEGNFFHMGDMCQKKSCVGSTNDKNLALYYDLYYYIILWMWGLIYLLLL